MQGEASTRLGFTDYFRVELAWIMKPTSPDPVVEEIRAVRHELAERFGDDIDALCDFLVQEE